VHLTADCEWTDDQVLAADAARRGVDRHVQRSPQAFSESQLRALSNSAPSQAPPLAAPTATSRAPQAPLSAASTAIDRAPHSPLPTVVPLWEGGLVLSCILRLEREL
jgi:hypothetical protein